MCDHVDERRQESHFATHAGNATKLDAAQNEQ